MREPHARRPVLVWGSTVRARARYAALARVAVDDAHAERNTTVSNIATHFTRRCVEHGLPHDHAFALDAVTGAITHRDQRTGACDTPPRPPRRRTWRRRHA